MPLSDIDNEVLHCVIPGCHSGEMEVLVSLTIAPCSFVGGNQRFGGPGLATMQVDTSLSS